EDGDVPDRRAAEGAGDREGAADRVAEEEGGADRGVIRRPGVGTRHEGTRRAGAGARVRGVEAASPAAAARATARASCPTRPCVAGGGTGRAAVTTFPARVTARARRTPGHSRGVARRPLLGRPRNSAGSGG